VAGAVKRVRFIGLKRHAGLHGQGHANPPPNPEASMIIATGTARLTKDPETRATRSGKTVTILRVASDGQTRDSDPTFIDLETW
jgi:hypothetical protein